MHFLYRLSSRGSPKLSQVRVHRDGQFSFPIIYWNAGGSLSTQKKTPCKQKKSIKATQKGFKGFKSPTLQLSAKCASHLSIMLAISQISNLVQIWAKNIETNKVHRIYFYGEERIWTQRSWSVYINYYFSWPKIKCFHAVSGYTHYKYLKWTIMNVIALFFPKV